jgi:hypothetical protein
MMKITAVFVYLFLFLAWPASAEWYKGVTHVHSLWSDGELAPELIAAWYKERGYNFVCFSEHNLMQIAKPRYFPIRAESKLTPVRVQEIQKKFGKNWVKIKAGKEPAMMLKTHAELSAKFNSPGKFLLVMAEEITTPKGPHVNVINVGNIIPVATGKGNIIQQYIDAARNQSKTLKIPIAVHLNHPHYQDGISPEEVLATRGLRGFEIYSGTQTSNPEGNRKKFLTSFERYWDILLSLKQLKEPGEPLFGYASDDSHKFSQFDRYNANPGRGWIIVRAAKLTANALTEAMIRGDFYSSSGVTLKDIETTGQQIKLTIDQEPGVTYTTSFIGTKKGFDPASRPAVDEHGKERKTRIYSEDIGKTFFQTMENPAAYTFQGDELYVRAVVVSSKPQNNPAFPGSKETAWVQPVMLSAK